MTQVRKRYLLAEHTIGHDDLKSLAEWLMTDPWLTQAGLVREFEKVYADWLGVPYAVFVNSGSSANLLMYYALLASERLKNKKVIVPAVSWATTVAPAIQFGFEPVMCEADKTHWGLDLEHLERLLKEHDPGAVILVHVLGVPNDMEAVGRLQKQYGFLLMEDSCAGQGSRVHGRNIGTFGTLSSFSFFYGHHMSTIEGGMVCTSDPELHDILLHLRSHGWSKDATPENEERRWKEAGTPAFNRPFTFYYPGFNVRSSDLNAHIGLSQMKKFDQVVRRRVENHRIYQQRFLEAEGVSCQQSRDAEICSISFAGLASSLEHRDRIGAALRENGVETRPVGGGNMSRQPFWAKVQDTIPMPMADRIHECAFQLPNHPGLEPEDVRFICDV
ncbi:MAG: aminotransferase class I/II-fold pyridoxal phosphate-dependent enzyme, partial [Armatimonadetes bacterium]|nr:aminotransferase class I/II-fold pyridoxal phosphate-dependent enzyme [Armatimonadota bacterium]